MIVCITGFPGSGKSAVAKILQSKGYKVYELGDVVRDELRRRKMTLTPENEKYLSIYLRKRYGNDITPRLLLKRHKISESSKTVISGVRSIADLNYIKKHLKVITVAVVAPARTRFSRIKKRKRSTDPKTMSEFIRCRDKKEARFGMLGVIRNADYIISNTGTYSDLKKSVITVAKDAGLF